MSIQINSAFDSGNIICHDASNPEDIKLDIRPDHQSKYYQWFHFRVAGAKNVPCRFSIGNAGGAAYLGGWQDYRVCYSYDRETWLRHPTSYDDGVLSWSFTPRAGAVWFAYFAPYSMERHAHLIGGVLASAKVSLIPLGLTLDGQSMDVLKIGEVGEGKKTIWVTARQHPGETMAEWWMEGFLARLIDEGDAVSKALLEKAVIYAVPNMNPDGSRRGHLRTNAAGVDLNREWLAPSMERSPEVYLVREKMLETGADLCLDAHGDESIPNNFIAGGEGIPKWDDRHEHLLARYKGELLKESPDFQTQEGYPISQPGQANLKIGANWMAETFDCLGMTLEMPFKDTRATPDPTYGWSPERCRELGRANVAVMARLVDQLR